MESAGIKIIQALSEREKKAAFQVRHAVFVHEQQVPIDLEIDEHEDESIHFLCTSDEKPIGASRLRFVDEFGKLERICVLREFRGKSFGKSIIAAMEAHILNEGYTCAKLNAQTHAIQFYEALGYRVVSDEFMDAGIPHVTMIKELN